MGPGPRHQTPADAPASGGLAPSSAAARPSEAARRARRGRSGQGSSATDHLGGRAFGGVTPQRGMSLQDAGSGRCPRPARNSISRSWARQRALEARTRTLFHMLPASALATEPMFEVLTKSGGTANLHDGPTSGPKKRSILQFRALRARFWGPNLAVRTSGWPWTVPKIDIRKRATLAQTQTM